MKSKVALSVLASLCMGLAACSDMQMGNSNAKTAATGSAGGANSQNANNQLEHCNTTLGTIAVVEDTNAPWYGVLTGQMHLGSTTPVLKLMIQQSNCFVVVDRGRAMANMMGERELEASGELRKNSKFGKGQMVSADYSLTPSITFSNNNAGAIGGAVGGLFGHVGAAVGSSLNSKEASTMLILDDNRSGVQLAAAEGSAKNWDIGIFGGVLGPAFAGMGGGYANTPEGKVIVAAFMDSYNGVVRAVRNYKAQNVEGGLGTGGQLGVQGSAEAQVPEMSLYDAQVRLNELGFNVGKPDGSMGKRTRSELQRFQKSRAIPVTGELDAATRSELSR